MHTHFLCLRFTPYPQYPAGHNSLDDSEEKVLPRLAITYGTLRRLGFSDARVEDCLQAIPGVDIEEAYEWVCDSIFSTRISTERGSSACHQLHRGRVGSWRERWVPVVLSPFSYRLGFSRYSTEDHAILTRDTSSANSEDSCLSAA